jgi:hypothetical protein
MRLRLDPAELDGRSVTGFDAYTTNVSVPVTTASWLGHTRIVPGHPEQSWLYSLITTRGQGMQMPPFATSKVDAVDSALVGEWIRRMPPVVSNGDDAGSGVGGGTGGMGTGGMGTGGMGTGGRMGTGGMGTGGMGTGGMGTGGSPGP